MRLKELFANPTYAAKNVVTAGGFLKPFVIAKAANNYTGNLDLAKRLIDDAAEGGADAIEFPTGKTASLSSQDAPTSWAAASAPAAGNESPSERSPDFWKKEFEELKIYCDKMDIEFLSTPFDTESAVFLNSLLDVFKISSSDITNQPFIQYLCQFNKPVIISTGAAFHYEIMEAVSWVVPFNLPIILMHSVLAYPTPPEDSSLGMLQALGNMFPQYIVGYADHTATETSFEILQIAALLGARIIEKRFKSELVPSTDDLSYAMDKNDLKKFIDWLEETQVIIGKPLVTSLPSEEIARHNARRSLVSARVIKKGATLTEADITWKKPAHGISPRNYSVVLGMKARCDIPADTVLLWSYLE